MADDRRWLDRAPPSDSVRVISMARLSHAPINVAVSSAEDQTVLVIQDDRARFRGVDQGDD
jgi:hypothetical protein